MKNLFTLFLVFYSFNLYSKCIGGKIDFYPKKSTISPNSCIIIDEIGSDDSDLINLTKKSKVFLISGNDKIELVLIKHNTGYRMQQFILKPSRNLKINKKYSLLIVGLDKFYCERYNSNTDKMGKVEWLVNEPIDKKSPYWIKKPFFLTKNCTEQGCGIEKFVNFSVAISENSHDCFINVKLKHKLTKKVSEFLIEYDNERKMLKIGHNMCFGRFEFINENEYEATFELYDICANRAFEVVNLSFVSPI